MISCESERSQPLVSSFCFGAAETVEKLVAPFFYFKNDTFDAVPISTLFVSEIEAMFFTGSVKWNRAINEKGRVIYIVFSRSSAKN
jgi:hypothetical protein